MDAIYGGRVDALEQTWRVWAELGGGLTEHQWSTATRCPGWDVAAVYAHHSAFPLMLTAPWPPAGESLGAPVTAGDVLRRYNARGGVAHTMADTVAARGVADAAAHPTGELVERFRVHGPRALQRLREAEGTDVVPWPASGAAVTLVEGLRIVVLEAVVHLLDVQRALGHPPLVPSPALHDTAGLLAELAPAVELIEAAAGRSAHSPWPVLR